MILAAALLVLVALGLFVAGLLSGVTAFYWTCVGVSAVAAVLLFVARRQLAAAPDEGRRPVARTEQARTEPARTGPATTEEPSPERAAEPAAAAAEPEAAEPETAEPRPAEPRPAEPEPAASETPSAAEPASPAPVQAAPATAAADADEPPAEEVEVSDLLLVVDMADDVFVVDEHPRYHLADCRWLSGRETIPLPVDEARTDGFSPCGLCSPDRHLAQVARARRAAGTS